MATTAKPKRKLRLAPTTSALVRAVAKKVVSDKLEDKYNRAEPQLGGQPVLFNAGISTFSDLWNLFPAITTGTEAHQRVGDTIRPKSLRVDFYVVANGALTTSMLNRVRLFVLEDKSIKNWANMPSTSIGTNLLDNGATLAGYSGIPNQETVRVNKRRYKVIKDKLFTVMKTSGVTPQTAGLGGTQSSMNSSQFHKISFKVPTPAKLQYSNPGDSWPNNFSPFLCLGYTQPDGDLAPDTGVTKMAFTFNSHLDYEDA